MPKQVLERALFENLGDILKLAQPNDQLMIEILEVSRMNFRDEIMVFKMPLPIFRVQLIE